MDRLPCSRLTPTSPGTNPARSSQFPGTKTRLDPSTATYRFHAGWLLKQWNPKQEQKLLFFCITLEPRVE